MNDQASFRVAAAGLDPRDARLIEIVFRHSQYNRFQFQLVSTVEPERMDILVANTTAPEGLAAVARLRSLRSEVPVIAAVPRGAASPARYSISIERLTLQLLPILNRVVEQEIVAPQERWREVASQPARVPGSISAPTQVPPAPSTWSVQAAAPARAPSSAPVPPSRFTAPGQPAAAPAPSPSSQAAAAPRPAPVPAAPPPAAQAAPPRPSRPAERQVSKLVEFPGSAERSAQRIRVLVVDDSPTVRQQLSIALNRMGLACDAVDSAAAAIEILSQTHFDLALVDVVLGQTDGYRLTREIRRSHRSTPVIILTSKSSPFDLARGALAGCKAYLVKPVPLRKLEAAVTKVLRKTLAIDDLAALMQPIPRAVRPEDTSGTGPDSRLEGTRR
jgi:CheY-like chemotaxis protein